MGQAEGGQGPHLAEVPRSLKEEVAAEKTGNRLKFLSVNRSSGRGRVSGVGVMLLFF